MVVFLKKVKWNNYDTKYAEESFSFIFRDLKCIRNHICNYKCMINISEIIMNNNKPKSFLLTDITTEILLKIMYSKIDY